MKVEKETISSLLSNYWTGVSNYWTLGRRIVYRKPLTECALHFWYTFGIEFYVCGVHHHFSDAD